MAKKSQRYIWQSVICLGFLSGLWTAIGFDPEETIISALGSMVNQVYPDPVIRFCFVLLPTILLAASVIGAYKTGKAGGLAAVLVAYIAGLLIFRSTETALVLLGSAIIIGWLSTSRCKKWR